jgi:aspartate aminotransferase, mitochondrial
VTGSSDERARLLSLLKNTARASYSNPPIYGARIVAEVLTSPDLKKQWAKDCQKMTQRFLSLFSCLYLCSYGLSLLRIMAMRANLRQHLEDLGSTRSWNHITDQVGMFCYTGLTSEQVCPLLLPLPPVVFLPTALFSPSSLPSAIYLSGGSSPRRVPHLLHF